MTAQPIDAPRGFVRAEELHRAMRRIDALLAEVADLRRELKLDADHAEMLALKAALPAMMPSVCRATLRLLAVSPKVVPHPILAHACTRWAENPVDTAKVMVCLARKALVAAGSPPDPIRVIWRVGYWMTPEARDWLTEKMAEHARQAAEAVAQPAAPETAPTATQSRTNGKAKRGGSR